MAIPKKVMTGTWHGIEGTLGVDGGLDGDDAFSFLAPAFMALSFHLKQVRMVGQKILDDHRVVRRVGHIDAFHFT